MSPQSHLSPPHPSPQRTEQKVATESTQARTLTSQATSRDSWYKNGKPLALRNVLVSPTPALGHQAPKMAQHLQEALPRGTRWPSRALAKDPRKSSPWWPPLAPYLHSQPHCAFWASTSDMRWDFSNLAVQIVVFADETDAKTTSCPHSLFIFRELPSFRWVHGYPACHDHTTNFYAIG